MKVTFKDVGQGDSILIEWVKDGHPQQKIGIVDCRKVGKRNPVLEYIAEAGILAIDFIIMSHPHFDHYSGMVELLNYCKENDVYIRYFGFSGSESPNHLRAFSKNESEWNQLETLFNRVHELDQQGVIGISGVVTYDWKAELNNDYRMRCLAPCGSELDLFLKRVYGYNQKNDERNARLSANLLSTILLIESKTQQEGVLLTSDSCLEAFDRILLKNSTDLEKFKLLLCQVPHHGALENHKIAFWRSLARDVNCPAIVSAGRHRAYKHPHRQVVKDFLDNNFKIHATNYVNGIEEIFSKRADEVSSKLDMGSWVAEEFDLEGDQIFHLGSGTAMQQAFEAGN